MELMISNLVFFAVGAVFGFCVCSLLGAGMYIRHISRASTHLPKTVNTQPTNLTKWHSAMKHSRNKATVSVRKNATTA